VELDDGAAIRRRFSPRSRVKRAVLDVAASTGLLGHLVHSFYLSSRKQ